MGTGAGTGMEESGGACLHFRFILIVVVDFIIGSVSLHDGKGKRALLVFFFF